LIKGFTKIRLIHLWDLRAYFEAVETNLLRVGLIDMAFHSTHLWNQKHRAFILEAMGNDCEQIGAIDTDYLTQGSAVSTSVLLSGAAFQMRETLNPGYQFVNRCLPVNWLPEETLLPKPPNFQPSFSRVYQSATQLAGSLDQRNHSR
jgi:hypothetical protein